MAPHIQPYRAGSVFLRAQTRPSRVRIVAPHCAGLVAIAVLCFFLLRAYTALDRAHAGWPGALAATLVWIALVMVVAYPLWMRPLMERK